MRRSTTKLPGCAAVADARYDSRKARSWLGEVGLPSRAAHRSGALSGAEQQRVSLARALVTGPKLLLTDEPTGDLDRHTADDILDLLQQLNRQHKKTIIMVTHDRKAADHASRQLQFDKGDLVEGRAELPA